MSGYLEVIKDGGNFSRQFCKIMHHFDQAAILDLGKRKIWKPFFPNPHICEI